MSYYLLIYKIFAILIFTLSLWLGLWVYFTNRKNKLNQIFLFLVVSTSLWVSLYYLVMSSDNPVTAVFWAKMGLGVVSLFYIPFYLFFIYFLCIENKFWIFNKIVLIWGIFLFILSVSTDFVVKGVEFEEVGVSIILGKGSIPIFLTAIVLSILVVTLLLKKYFRTSRQEKFKIQYFLFGIFIWTLMNFVFNMIPPLLQGKNTPTAAIGNLSAIFLLGFTAYAIVKHELMGIKTLITQVLIVIISLILLIDVILLSDNVTMQLLKIGILLSFLYFSRGMVESVRNEKKAREELEKTYKKINEYIEKLKKTNINLKEKNEDLGALLDISGVVTGTLDSKKIAQNIVDSIPKNLKHLGYGGGILVLYDKRKEMAYTYALTESNIVRKARKLLNKPLEEYAENINYADNLVIKTIKTKKMRIGDKLEDFIAPTVNKKTCILIQKMVRAKSFISIPIFSGGRIKGTIVFVGTKPKKKIIQRDKDILFSFSSHIGAAIENAQLYEQTENQIKALSILNENLKMANLKLKDLMDMKNEFLHITSHQLRTPLTAIRGMVSMWINGDFNNLSEKEKKEMLNRIYTSSERLNNITNDMLDSLELEGGFMKFQFSKVPLRKIIKETIDIMKADFDKKGLYIKFNEKMDEIKIEAEPNYIRQAFMNIIDNACKYTRKGGVDIDIEKRKEKIEITIKDTGIGVSKKDQKRIFDKFTRGERASMEYVSGSGLGLFIVKKVIEAHRGNVEFLSKGNEQGSTVKITLPIKQGGYNN